MLGYIQGITLKFVTFNWYTLSKDLLQEFLTLRQLFSHQNIYILLQGNQPSPYSGDCGDVHITCFWPQREPVTSPALQSTRGFRAPSAVFRLLMTSIIVKAQCSCQPSYVLLFFKDSQHCVTST